MQTIHRAQGALIALLCVAAIVCLAAGQMAAIFLGTIAAFCLSWLVIRWDIGWHDED